MHINKFYLHPSLILISLLSAAVFDQENQSHVNVVRYLYTIATIISLAILGFIGFSAKSAPVNIADDEKTITVSKAEYESPIPGIVNPFDEKAVKMGTVELTASEYDIHTVANMMAISGIIAVLTMLYHLINGSLIIMVWYVCFTLVSLFTSPLVEAYLLRQRVGRPYRIPSIKDDLNAIKKEVQQVQKQMKKELQEVGDDLHGGSSNKGSKDAAVIAAAKKAKKLL